MPKEATLCFVKYNDSFLMINREKKPFKGLWNAVGGKRIDGESLEDCAKREIFEESGIKVESVSLQSVFTWNYDDEIGYAFVAVLPDDFCLSDFPKQTEEGVVAFKKFDWILSEDNYGVIEDLQIFIKDIFDGVRKDYQLIYSKNKLMQYIQKDYKNIY